MRRNDYIKYMQQKREEAFIEKGHISGRLPLGYTRDANKEIIIDEEIAPQIRKVLEIDKQNLKEATKLRLIRLVYPEFPRSRYFNIKRHKTLYTTGLRVAMKGLVSNFKYPIIYHNENAC